MADELTMELAIKLAESLTTIGHPRMAGAILATAQDLLEWCTGAILKGAAWSPARQAQWLVDTARRDWAEEGWPERGGTGRLRDLFRKKFLPDVKPGNTFVDYANEPCICGRPKKFRDCCQRKIDPDDPLEELRRKIQ